MGHKLRYTLTLSFVLSVRKRVSLNSLRFCFLFRETLLQALRGVIAGAGQKMGDPIKKTLTTTLLDLLGHGDVSTF